MRPTNCATWALCKVQALCRFGCAFFALDVVQGKHILALKTLGRLLIGNHQRTAAIWARRGNRLLPGSKLAGRIIGTTVEDAPLARAPFHNFAAIQWAGDSDLLQPGFRVPAFGKALTTYEFAITTPADNQLTLATGRASATDIFNLGLGFRAP